MIGNIAWGFTSFVVFFAVTYFILELIYSWLPNMRTAAAAESVDNSALPMIVSNEIDIASYPQYHAQQQQPQQVNYYITHHNNAPVQEKTPAPEKVVEVVKQNYTPFITRQEIAERTKSLGNKCITVNQYKMESQIPMSLKWKQYTFAMLYADDEGLLAILALDSIHANELSKSHPDIHRPKFPKGSYWYTLKINHKTFQDKEEVYQMLDTARAYIEFSKTPQPKSKSDDFVKVDLKAPYPIKQKQ